MVPGRGEYFGRTGDVLDQSDGVLCLRDEYRDHKPDRYQQQLLLLVVVRAGSAVLRSGSDESGKHELDNIVRDNHSFCVADHVLHPAPVDIPVLPRGAGEFAAGAAGCVNELNFKCERDNQWHPAEVECANQSAVPGSMDAHYSDGFLEYVHEYHYFHHRQFFIPGRWDTIGRPWRDAILPVATVAVSCAPGQGFNGG